MEGLLRRRFETESWRGSLVHEMQVAHACDKWLARLVTLPDRVWRDPGQRHLLIFNAGTREEVEAAAFTHLLRECELRGERILGLNYAACRNIDGQPARRVIAMYPLQYQLHFGGTISGSRAIEDSFTANLSETGLFIVTARLIEQGALLNLRLRLPGCTQRMEGQVRWLRTPGEEGRPPGAGVQLVDPPLTYRAKLQTLR